MDDLIGPMGHLNVTTGIVSVRGLDVRWWKYENDSLRRLGRRPVVALHGGPAFTHNYILPLQLLADSGHAVIFYDQAGCGESTFVKDPSKDAPWLLTIPYYVEELSRVTATLGLDCGSGYHLYGSSWGTVLAQEFAATKPFGLCSLILDGALCDAQVYIKTQWRDRISTMPTYTQRLLRHLEDTKAYDTAAYRVLEAALGLHFTTRLVPRPACWYAALNGLNQAIYVGMQGASEFTLGGQLEHWSITERNAQLRVPTLVLAGEFDTMSQECQQLVVDSIPTAWPLVTIPRAAHCKLIDEPQLCVEAIARFLFAIEQLAQA